MRSAPLGQLLREISRLQISAEIPAGLESILVRGVRYDSRAVRPDDLFVCVRGLHSDGHSFAYDAARDGASCIVGEEEIETPGTPYVRVSDSRRALALLACSFHGHPGRDLVLTGVTGTNGKTSVTWMVDAILRSCGFSPAVLGTLGAGPVDQLRPGPHTTPEAPDLQAELASWRDRGITHGALEVSSHGLAMRRTYGTRFRCAVFTNITPEHLDFHTTMEEYLKAKSLLFSRTERGPEEPPCTAAVRMDDPAAEALIANSDDRILGYGRGAKCDVRLVDEEFHPDGLRLSAVFPGGGVRIESPLLGTFQAENLLAAFTAALCLGLPPEDARRGLESLRGVPGRMERVDDDAPFRVVVDYSHTPDALARALESLRPFTPGRLCVVFGCGGDRDQAKRPIMGEIAARLADRIILTDDNPRTEDPAAIRAQIAAAFGPSGVSFREIGDREQAIAAALNDSRAGDTVLLAGKGHESAQIRGGESLPFDDREVARRLLGGEGSS